MLYEVSDPPLTTGRTLRVALRNSLFGENAIKSLQCAQTITMLHVSRVPSTRFQRSPEAILQQNILDSTEIVHHTSEIHLRSLQIPLVPFSSTTINRNSARGLCRAVESTSSTSVAYQASFALYSTSPPHSVAITSFTIAARSSHVLQYILSFTNGRDKAIPVLQRFAGSSLSRSNVHANADENVQR